MKSRSIELKERISLGAPGAHEWTAVAALLSLILLACAAAIWPGPPDAAPASAPSAEFSAERAMRHVVQIAQRPRPIGSAQHAKVREYILEELQRLSLDREEQNAVVFGPARGGAVSAASAINVIGTLKGSAGGKATALVAHYDSVSTGPGAADNGAGVAAVLEILRALKSGAPPKNDVIALFTDGEEIGLFGARGYVEESPSAKKIGTVLNFDARGVSGPSLMFETSGGNGALIEEFSKASSRPVASSFFYEVYKRLPNDTDFSVFKRAGMAGFNFAFLDGVARYHTALDTVENLDPRSLQHQGEYGLALARRLDEGSPRDQRQGDAIYFDILGLTLVHYPAGWAPPLAILTGLFYLGLLGAGLWRGRLRALGIAMGAVLTLLGVAGSVGLFLAVWRLIEFIHPDVGLATVGDVQNNRLYAAGFVLLSLAFSSALFTGFRKKFEVLDLTVGGLGWWAILMTLTALSGPGASYLFTWPLLLMETAIGVRLLLMNRPEASVHTLAIYLLGALAGLALVAPVISLAFIGLTIKSSAPVAALVALLLALLLPLVNMASRQAGWTLPAGLGVVSAGLFLAALWTSGFDRNYPRQTHLLYGLNSDAGNAIWASLDDRPNEWNSQFLSSSPTQAALNDFFSLSSRKFLQASATPAPMAGPVLQLLEESRNAQGRTLQLHLSSPRQAPLITLVLENANVIDASVAARRVDPRFMADTGEAAERWGLRYYNLPAEGVDLRLTVRSSEALRFRCVDFSYGFEQLASVGFKPRPDWMIPTPASISDMVMVSRSFTF